MVEPTKFLVVTVLGMIAVITNELEENRAEQSEDECLDEADQELHEVERKGREEGKLLRHERHQGFQRLLTTVNVSKKSESQSNRADQNRNHLERTDEKEHWNHYEQHHSLERSFGRKDVSQEALDTIFADCPIEPKSGEGERHRSCHVDIRIGTTHPRKKSAMAVAIDCVPTEGPNSRDQAHVVVGQDEKEDRTKEPERAGRQMGAHQTRKEIIERLHCPLGEILEALRNDGHFLGRDSCKQHENRNRQPNHDHGIVDRQAVTQTGGIQRQGMMTTFGGISRNRSQNQGEESWEMRATDHSERRLGRKRARAVTNGFGKGQELFVKNFTSSTVD